MLDSIRRTVTPLGIALAFLAVASLAVPRVATADTPLYERLGGAYPIAMVVDEFIDRLLADDTLNANPAIDEARKRVPPAGLKYHVTSFMIQATGGPEVYIGRGMEEAHAHLDITEKEWRAMVAEFRAVLYAFNVPEPEQQELIDLVTMVKEEVVSVPSQ